MKRCLSAPIGFAAVVLTAAALMSAGSAMAQTLWRGTTYGMSPDQVQAAVPEAAPALGKPSASKSGAVELLRINDFELVGVNFYAKFFFKDLKLVQVVLTAKEPGQFATRLRSFEAITTAMRAKYGPELSRTVTDIPLPTARAEWLSDGANISLNLIEVMKYQALLSLSYQATLAAEASKL